MERQHARTVPARPEEGTPVLIWGQRALLGWLLLSLAATVLLMRVSPALVAVPALLPVAVLGGLLLFRRPLLNLFVLLSGCTFVLSSQTGLQLAEVLIGPYLLAFLGYWYARQVVLGRASTGSSIDTAVFLFVGGGLVWGVALGVLHGAAPSDMQGDAVSFLFFGLYFPVKDACARERRAAVGIGLVLVGYALYAVGYNLYWLWYTVTSATELWQIVDVRKNMGELPIMTAALILLAFVGTSRTPARRLGAALLFAVVFGGLLLTKSRGYWVSFALGAIVVVILLRRTERARLATASVIGVGVTAVALFTVFKSYASLIVAGTITRFETLGTATTQDISLLNRFVESAAVWDYITSNPIAGYGFGTTFHFFDIILRVSKDTAFIHNGYLGVWFKLGVFGLIAIGAVWVWTIARGVRFSMRPPTSAESDAQSDSGVAARTILIGCVSALVAGLLVANTSNPFIEIDTALTMTLTLALVNGRVDRARGLLRP